LAVVPIPNDYEIEFVDEEGETLEVITVSETYLEDGIPHVEMVYCR